MHLEMIISSHIQIDNVVMELYVKFADADGSDLSLTTIAMNTGTKAAVRSLTTQLCGGFSGLLQSDNYDVSKISMGRHSSFSNFDLNFGGQYQSRYQNNPNFDTRALTFSYCVRFQLWYLIDVIRRKQLYRWLINVYQASTRWLFWRAHGLQKNWWPTPFDICDRRWYI